MAAPKGSKNALGNSGGKSLNDRKLSASVRTLALNEIKAILERPEMDEMKKQIILKLAPTLLPRLNEHTGEDGNDLIVKVTSYASDNPNSLPVPTESVSTGIPASSTEVQDWSVSPESGKEQDSPQPTDSQEPNS
jgi:hypothetical protein